MNAQTDSPDVADESASRVKPKFGFKKIVLALLGLVVATIAGWIVYINLPGPEYAVTPARNLVEQSNQDAAEVSLPFNISVVYSPGYLINLGGMEKMHPFDIRKYEKIHNGLINDGLLTEAQTLKPAPLTKDELLLIHSREYLDELQVRKKVAQYLELSLIHI